jgi:RNA polymerase sigma-70 factor (ECF subfamily)
VTDGAGNGHEEGVVLALQAIAAPALIASKETFVLPQFREIYDEHFNFVYRSARRLGVHERSLDDATQDVFIVVHRRLGDFEGRSGIKTWLYGITRRVAKDYRRRVGRKERGMVPTDGLASNVSSPDENAAKREAVQVLETILSSLDPAKREVFMLAEMEQMTAPEISDALSVNLNTVYSRLRNARAEFEKAVSRHLAKLEAQA